MLTLEFTEFQETVWFQTPDIQASSRMLLADCLKLLITIQFQNQLQAPKGLMRFGNWAKGRFLSLQRQISLNGRAD